MPYSGLRDFLEILESDGRLHRVAREVDKDWEVAAVCRRLFQVVPQSQRPAILFEKIRGHQFPIAAGVLGGSRAIYAKALETTIEGVHEKWAAAYRKPIPPRTVSDGPVQENVLVGRDADVTSLPVPVWTVGQDPGPYITAAYVFTCDPETGVRNVGTYRVQVMGPRKLGIMISYQQDGARHVRLAEQMGEPLPVAIVLGTDPTLGLCSVTNMPYGLDEVAVAGGLRGEPVDLVRCRTVPLEVPATAEIVIEGTIQPGVREWEGPFGEYPGYMGSAGHSPVIDVSSITHRDEAIYHAFVSQMPPSESSCIRAIGHENSLFKHLTQELGLPVTGVHFLESGGSSAYVVIAMKKEHEGQPKQAIWGAWGWDAGYGKITIVVDDDIDITDSFQVEWALSFRTQPGRDFEIVNSAPPVRLDPSVGSASLPKEERRKLLGSKVAIDATMKHDYPGVALPPREHLELVDEHWAAYGFGGLAGQRPGR